MSIKSGPNTGTGIASEGFFEYHGEVAIVSLSTFFCKVIKPCSNASGVGGQPAT